MKRLSLLHWICVVAAIIAVAACGGDQPTPEVQPPPEGQPPPEIDSLLQALPEDADRFTFADMDDLRDDGFYDLEERLEDLAGGRRLRDWGIDFGDVQFLLIADHNSRDALTLLQGNFFTEDVGEALDDEGFREDSYRGVAIWTERRGDVAIALVAGDAIAIGDEDRLAEVIDVLRDADGSMEQDRYLEEVLDFLEDVMLYSVSGDCEYSGCRLLAGSLSGARAQANEIAGEFTFYFSDAEAASEVEGQIERGLDYLLGGFEALGKSSDGSVITAYLAMEEGQLYLDDDGLMAYVTREGPMGFEQVAAYGELPDSPTPTTQPAQAHGVPGTLLWRYRTNGDVDSSPVVTDGVVYVGSDDDNVYALDADTGQLRWRYQTGGNVDAAPAVSGRMVYVGSHDDHVYALDTATGQPRWRYRTGANVRSWPTVSGSGMVYVGSDDGNLYALDADTGELRWRYTARGDFVPSPALYSGMIYAGSDDGNIYALDAASGELLWRFQTGGIVTSSAAVSNGMLFVGAFDGYLYALEAASGELRWRYWVGGPEVWSSPAVSGGTVYVGSRDNHLYALDAVNGELLWRWESGDDIFSSPEVANGVIYISSHDHHLYALEAATGKLLWRYDMGDALWSSPVVSDGVVYVGSRDDHLYAIVAGIPEPTATVPKADSIYLSAGGDQGFGHPDRIGFTCALRQNGEALCWGHDSHGQSSPPPGRFTAISSGHDHTCGLRESGEAVCWGGNSRGQSSPSAGRFTAISSASWYACGLRESGEAVCWGGAGHGGEAPPDGRFTALSAGYDHTCGLRESGQAVCWGADFDGQATQQPGRFTAISAGRRHTCGLRENGEAVCWGSNEQGRAAPVDGRFTAISAGKNHTCGSRENGEVACWGNNDNGQTDVPRGLIVRTTPTDVSAPTARPTATIRPAPTAAPPAPTARPAVTATPTPTARPAPTAPPAPTAVPTPRPAPTARPAPTPVPAAEPEGDLNIAVERLGFSEPVPWSFSGAGVGSLRFIYDPLFEAGHRPRPGLVQAWEVSVDGREWWFHLRRGVPFHNGDELKASDVVFSHNKDIDTLGNNLSGINREPLELIDDYTIAARTRDPRPWLDAELAGYYYTIGMPFSKAHYEQVGAEEFARNPVGTGPYRHVSHGQDRLELEAAGFHWRHGVPTVDRVRFLEVPDSGTRAAALLTGQVDITDLLPEHYQEARGNGFQVFLREGWTTVGFRIHQQWDDVPIADPRVRRALNLAVDRQAMADTLFHGLARPASVPVRTIGSMDWFAPEPYEYDPDMARQLLAEAGYPDGFELAIHAYDRGSAPYPIQSAQALASYYRDIGVRANLSVSSYSEFRPRWLGHSIAGDMSNLALAARPMYRVFTVLSNLFQFGNRFTTTKDHDLDRLLSEMTEEFDTSRAEELLWEFLWITHENANYLPLLHVDLPYGASQRVPADWNLGYYTFVPDYLDAVRRR